MGKASRKKKEKRFRNQCATFADYLMTKGFQFHPDTVIIDARQAVLVYKAEQDEIFKNVVNRVAKHEPFMEWLKTCLPIFPNVFLWAKDLQWDNKNFADNVGYYIEKRDDVYLATFINDRDGILHMPPVSAKLQFDDDGYIAKVVGINESLGIAPDDASIVYDDEERSVFVGLTYTMLKTFNLFYQKHEVELVEYPKQYRTNHKKIMEKNHHHIS